MAWRDSCLLKITEYSKFRGEILKMKDMGEEVEAFQNSREYISVNNESILSLINELKWK